MSGRESGGEAPALGVMVGHLLVQRARAVTRKWNDRHPMDPVPVEWAEEAARAFAAADLCGATVEGLEWQRWGLEFTEKLPLGLVQLIFRGTPL